MVKYEYLVIPSDQAEATQHVQTTFAQYGEDGWDLKSVSAKFFIFSRRLTATK